MVVARNIGRLGNNLFQIAAAIGYAKKYGYQWAVDPQPGLSEPYSSIHQTFPHLPKQQPSGVRYHEHPHGICEQHKVSYDRCHFDYHEIPDLGPNVFLTGFFQSWKYFEHCKEEVLNTFRLPLKPIYQDHVSLHIRRGDYVQHSGSFPPITMDYVNMAVKELQRIGVYVTDIICFSDDIQWCKENVKIEGVNVEFCEEQNELEALGIMASCGHHIIANSSFSWWGAYLGHSPDKIVIAPSCIRGNWFGLSSGVLQDCVDLLPKEWVQIIFR